MLTRKHTVLIALAAVAAALIACELPANEEGWDELPPEGGHNFEERRPGNTDDGATLYTPNRNRDRAESDEEEATLEFYGEVVLDPTGTYFVTRVGKALYQGHVRGGHIRILPGIDTPVRIGFDPIRPRIYYTDEGGDLVSYDLVTLTEVWRNEGPSSPRRDEGNGLVAYPLLSVNPNGHTVARTDHRRVSVLDAATGAMTGQQVLAGQVLHVSRDPHRNGLWVVEETQWENRRPRTNVTYVDFFKAEAFTESVPNCAAPVTVPSVGDMVFMAPTVCWVPETQDWSNGDPNRPRPEPRRRTQPRTNVDPISVIDAHSKEFVRNLPGYGPVSATPDGRTVIGFLDLESVDPTLFDDVADIPSGDRYQLMFVDAQTLEYDFLPVGETMPRHAITPEGSLLLVDFPDAFTRIRVVDIRDRSLHTVTGPRAQLNSYVMTQDAGAAYFLSEGLKKLDLDRLEVIDIPLDVAISGINLTPDDRHLVLRGADRAVKVMNLELGKITHSMDLTPEAAASDAHRQLHTFMAPPEETKPGLTPKAHVHTPELAFVPTEEVETEEEAEVDAVYEVEERI